MPSDGISQFVIMINFKKSALTVLLGSFGAQFISIAASPILARLYEPYFFGIFATFLSLVGIIGAFSSLRIERKIITESNSVGTLGALIFSVGTSFLMSLLATGFTLLLHSFDYIELKIEYFIFVFVFSFFFAVYQSLVLFASKINKFTVVAISSITRAAIVLILQLSLFLFVGKEYALTLAATGGLIIASFIVYWNLGDHNFNSDFLKIYRDYYNKKYNFKNCFYGGVQSLTSALSNNLPILIISAMGGYIQAGIYLMAERLVRMPINLISNNLRNVIAAKISQDITSANDFLFRLSLSLLLLGIGGYCIFLFVSDWLFRVFLGDKWIDSSEVAKIMFLWVVFNLYSLPYQSYNITHGLLRQLAFLEIVFALLKFTLLVVAYKWNGSLVDAAYVIVGTSIAYSLSHIVMYYKTVRFS